MNHFKKRSNCLKKSLFFLSIILGQQLFAAQATNSGIASCSGKITSNGKNIPYAAITIKNTTIGTISQPDGSFKLEKLPTGNFILKVQSLGYASVEKDIQLEAHKEQKVTIELEEDIFGLEQVVVTADRNEQKRINASTIVNNLDAKQLNNLQAVAVCDALSYIPGLRTETNCQNCGMVQVRMNGMEGHYSQILINSRPIFSGLVSVYGLELFPTAMIDQVEVIRGGGSALYGSNAIAGTVNIITKDPVINSYEAQIHYGTIGVGLNEATPANEIMTNFKTTLLTDSKKTGISLFASLLERDHFDANDDTYSELMELKNLSMGTRFFHRLGYRSKVTFDFFRINEDRRGGNKFSSLFHEADLTEAVQHKITTGALTYEYFMGSNSQLSLFGSAQNVDRGSYYGADHAMDSYGQTDGLTYTFGTQFKTTIHNNTLVTGIELVGDKLKDQKLGFPDYSRPIYDTETGDLLDFEHEENTTIAKQDKTIYGGFLQYDKAINKIKLSAGLRFDHYEIKDRVHGTGDCNGNILSPRLCILWHLLPNLQTRATYSQGYRAPQIFDEDLHISASGSRQVVHKNASSLKQETSHSYMFSMDYNSSLGSMPFTLLAEGFYTFLNNPFVSNPGEVDEDGVVTYFRTNSNEGAYVQGVNIESNLYVRKNLYVNLGFTLQKSVYEEAQELNTKDFLRTPKQYGFMNVDWDATEKICVIATAKYTGSMPIAYYDQNKANDDSYAGELRNTKEFFDCGVKIEYAAKAKELPLKLFCGTKNLFNSFQSDFETGTERDPTYIYGPSQPRMIYGGIKISK